jgi:hypothetical protein
MDIMTPVGTPDSSFVPQACTLPTAEQPLRVAEFAQLFAAAARTIVRASPTSLHLVLDGDATAARELAARETECCSFFTFTFHPASDEASAGLELTVAVPATHVGVLDGLQRLAETATRGQASA